MKNHLLKLIFFKKMSILSMLFLEYLNGFGQIVMSMSNFFCYKCPSKNKVNVRETDRVGVADQILIFINE